MELPGPPSPKNPACDFRRTGLKPRKSTIKFQFHIGAIRSFQYTFEYTFFDEFQFHIGAIRRGFTSGIGHPYPSFNSILVQLEGKKSE